MNIHPIFPFTTPDAFPTPLYPCKIYVISCTSSLPTSMHKILFFFKLGRLQSILDPFDFRWWPDASNNLSIDQTQRHRPIVSGISRPGKVVSSEIDMALGNLNIPINSMSS